VRINGIVEIHPEGVYYVDTIRHVYEPEELGAMFRTATEDEATLLKFVPGSGFRDQEIRCVEWKDIDFRNHDVRVKAKPHSRFTPKNWEERVVPLPAGSIERLRKRKEARGALPNQLVFPNGRGKPDSEMDMVVKRVAQRAGLNCKQCMTVHNEHVCRRALLHELFSP
jgi:integrase/recombinase XerD